MSTHIKPTDSPVYWGVEYQSSLILADVCPIGGAVATPLVAYHDADENAYLGKVAGKSGSYKPLPDAGAALVAGEIYGYGGGLVIVRQSHTRTTHAPADVPALFSVYRAGAGTQDWIANEPVLVGTRRKYNSVDYVCLQAHVTQTDWTPPVVPALWQIYVQPTGAWAYPVAYKIGDKATYNGSAYECIQAHTSQAGWTPPVVPALWRKL